MINNEEHGYESGSTETLYCPTSDSSFSDDVDDTNLCFCFISDTPLPQNLDLKADSPGQHDFDINVISKRHNNPSLWEFSEALQTLYVAVNEDFPVAFSIKPFIPRRPPPGLADTNFFIRATPIFSNFSSFPKKDQMNTIIPLNHEHFDTSYMTMRHVSMDTPPSAVSSDRGRSISLSGLDIVFPLLFYYSDSLGTVTTLEHFRFVCNDVSKTSVPHRPMRDIIGNRKSLLNWTRPITQVLFRLENRAGQVLGHRLLRVRVCSSCPQTIRNIEECGQPEFYGGRKRYLEHHAAVKMLPAKKLKVDQEPTSSSSSSRDIDTRRFTANFTIVGTHNVKSCLEYARALMAQEIVKLMDGNEDQKKSGEDGRDAPFRKAYREIDALIRNSS